MSSSLSSYSKTIQRRNQSAEDKIIDDNYSNGLISTDAYIRELQDRQTRTYLTPLQRTNLGIKIRDTEEKYTDEMMQTAYQSGGFFNGQKIDDSYMLSYEKSKLEKMDPNSTAYQQQVQKVQSLQTKIEKQARKELRTQRELEIARTPAYNFETLRAKQQMYEELADDALADGDVDAYKSYLIQATNYENAADKAENGFNVNADVQKLNEDRFLNSQDIKYGDTSKVGSKVPGAVSTPVPGSQMIEGAGQTAGTPEENPNPQEEEDVLDMLERMSWGDISDFYNKDDLRRLESANKSLDSKKKSLESMYKDKVYYDQLADRYIDAANASTDPDEQLKYWRMASDAAQKSTDLFNRIDETEAEIENAGIDYSDTVNKVNKGVANRILSEVESRLLLDKAALDEELQIGHSKEDVNKIIDKELFIDGNANFANDYIRLLNVKRHVFGDIYNDQEEVIKIDKKVSEYQDELIRTEAQYNNKWAWEPIMDKSTGMIKLQNVQDEKDTVNASGDSMFNVKYQQIGNAYVPVEYKNKKGEVIGDLDNKTSKELEDYRKVAIIWRTLVPNGPRIQTVTEFTKDGNIQKISVRDDKGNLQPYFERPGKNFGNKWGFWDTQKAKFTNFGEFVGEIGKGISNAAGKVVESVGNIFAEDRKNKDNFLRSVVGQPTQSVSNNLRSMQLPSLFPKTYAAEGRMLLANVPEEYSQEIINAANANGIKPETLAGMLAKESWDFNPKYVSGYHQDGSGRGIAGIDKAAHPEIPDEQAFNPKFSINWAAKELGSLKNATGSEFDALRPYNGGLSGYNRPNVAGTTNKYASDVLERAKTHTQTMSGVSSDIKSDVKGLRSQNQNINYAGTILSGQTLGPNSKLLKTGGPSIELRSQQVNPLHRWDKTVYPNQEISDTQREAFESMGGGNNREKEKKNTGNKGGGKKTNNVVKTVAPVIKAVTKPIIKSVVNNNPVLKRASDTVSNVKKFVSNPVQTVKEAAKKTWDDTKKRASKFTSGIRSLFK